MVAEVQVLYETNARDIVAQLRLCADNIEKGDECYRGAVLCLAGPGGTVNVYAWGDLDNYSALGVLDCAKQRIHRVVSGS